MKSIITALIATAVLGAPVFTQDAPQPAQAPQASQQPRTPQAAQAPQAERERQPAEERERTLPPHLPPSPPLPGERRPIPTRNVKVDVTITEQTGTASPVRKVVSMIVADGRSSGVRSVTDVPFSDGGSRGLPLNVDAVINVTPDGKVLLDLRFNYASLSFVTPPGAQERPPVTDAQRDMTNPRAAQSTITENLSVLLTPGTPLVAAKSADAASDRTVTVEVKAEILK